ncbi:hypothetical protein GCM10025862_02940 [Arsenicicoccus piscis]|uniref:Uncharacterized protein n=1 Tax=Arsenicicoccus piscis TaxID=673954 RepID=A0ABQ6HJK7_9MICO|nr:hypothetical protein GCM10025862_02940 [Arsenicicoccus piscis]
MGDLIERYTEVLPDVELIGYRHGYHGVLTGSYTVFDEETRKNAGILRNFGGSPIGNSRVKLTNAKNLVERGLVKEGENPSRSPRTASRRTASTSCTPSAGTTPTPPRPTSPPTCTSRVTS